MNLNTINKKEIFKTYGSSDKDTGSTEVQLALFTERIKHITKHLKNNHKDYHNERSLILLVGKRKRLLKYLQNKDINRFPFLDIHFFPTLPLPLVCISLVTKVGSKIFFFINFKAISLVLFTFLYFFILIFINQRIMYLLNYSKQKGIKKT